MGAARLLLLALLTIVSRQGFGQQNCPLPPSLVPVAAGTNIFTEQQEVYLGDVMAEHVSQTVTILHEDALTEHVKQLGNQLIRYLPETKLHFQFLDRPTRAQCLQPARGQSVRIAEDCGAGPQRR
jgi:predicted Zn-dependent protease